MTALLLCRRLYSMAGLPNTTVKINYETNHARMHAKSYLFKRDTGFTTAYIGSFNLSNPALTGGLEWNVKVTEKESFDIVKKFTVSFDSYWNDDTFEEFNPEDEECCKKLQDELSKPMFERGNPRHLQIEIRPYAYQQEILDNLEAEREVHGHCKNLVVAATGAQGKIQTRPEGRRKQKRRDQKAPSFFMALKRFLMAEMEFEAKRMSSRPSANSSSGSSSSFPYIVSPSK